MRLAAARSVRHGQMGQAEQAIAEALTVRAIQERTGLADEWAIVVPINLPRTYIWLRPATWPGRPAPPATPWTKRFRSRG